MEKTEEERAGLQFGVIFIFQEEGKIHLLLSLLPNSKVSCFYFPPGFSGPAGFHPYIWLSESLQVNRMVER